MCLPVGGCARAVTEYRWGGSLPACPYAHVWLPACVRGGMCGVRRRREGAGARSRFGSLGATIGSFSFHPLKHFPTAAYGGAGGCWPLSRMTGKNQPPQAQAILSWAPVAVWSPGAALACAGADVQALASGDPVRSQALLVQSRTSHPRPKPSCAFSGFAGSKGLPADVCRIKNHPSPAADGWPPGAMCG
jgi:hypothetical protein